MKYSCFSKIQIKIKIINVPLARKGKALARGIFTETCFSKKEIVR